MRGTPRFHQSFEGDIDCKSSEGGTQVLSNNNYQKIEIAQIRDRSEKITGGSHLFKTFTYHVFYDFIFELFQLFSKIVLSKFGHKIDKSSPPTSSAVHCQS